MSRNDDSRTPSGWQKGVPARDAGHDEMQAAEWRKARELKPGDFVLHLSPGYTRATEYFYVGAVVEFSFTYRGRVIGFADIGIRFESHEPEEIKVRRAHPELGRYVPVFEPEVWWSFLEVKPVIGSVGAVIRQCRATVAAARQHGLSKFDISAVVYADDPKLALLTELSPFPILARQRPVQEARP